MSSICQSLWTATLLKTCKKFTISENTHKVWNAQAYEAATELLSSYSLKRINLKPKPDINLKCLQKIWLFNEDSPKILSFFYRV